MHELQRAAVAVSVVASVALAASAAHAAVAEGEPQEHHAVVGQVQPGTTIEGHVGYGFDPTYDTGFGGRLGYTLSQGVYLGGDATHFVGSDGTPKETLLGGDVGLKLFPIARIQVRPYGFGGAQIPSTGRTQLALAPASSARTTSAARTSIWTPSTWRRLRRTCSC